MLEPTIINLQDSSTGHEKSSNDDEYVGADNDDKPLLFLWIKK
jgi:hypothetical protein